MPKISKILFISSILMLVAMPAFAQLTLGPKCDPTLPPNQQGSCNISAFLTWIRQIIRFMLTVAIPLGVLFIVYGAFVIITAGGSESKVEQGKGIITAAAIGVAIAFASWLIVTTVERILKGGF